MEEDEDLITSWTESIIEDAKIIASKLQSTDYKKFQNTFEACTFMDRHNETYFRKW